MAQRRMFSKTITNSSLFLTMPHSCQALYLQLGMNADDDGYCEHVMVVRMGAFQPDDLKILHAKGFVHVFDDMVLVIKDWSENNYIKKDRYSPSKYLNIHNVSKMYPKCIQNVSKMYPKCIQNGDTGKVRLELGKVRLELNNRDVKIKELDIKDFETLFKFWEQNKKGGKYKNKSSRERMFNKLKTLTNNNYQYAREAILFCIDNNYQGFCNGDVLYYKKSINKQSNAYPNQNNQDCLNNPYAHYDEGVEVIDNTKEN